MPLTQNSPEELAQYLTAVSAMIELPIAPEYVSGVKRYLQISLRMAAILEGVPLHTEDDFAPVFHAQ
ncbi:MAG: DUF4089 domain-containing protein [Acidithiobacillus sp.]